MDTSLARIPRANVSLASRLAELESPLLRSLLPGGEIPHAPSPCIVLSFLRFFQHQCKPDLYYFHDRTAFPTGFAMLCIDTQGSFKDSPAQGVIGDIKQDAVVKVKKGELQEVEVMAGDPEVIDDALKSPHEEAMEPRKLVKDEHRETGVLSGQLIKAILKLYRNGLGSS